MHPVHGLTLVQTLQSTQLRKALASRKSHAIKSFMPCKWRSGNRMSKPTIAHAYGFILNLFFAQLLFHGKYDKPAQKEALMFFLENCRHWNCHF